nr:hypothetical protein SY563_000050 [Bacillus thuringiensis]
MSGIYKLVSQSIKQRGRELKMGRFKCDNCGVYEMILTKGLCDDCVNKKEKNVIVENMSDLEKLKEINERWEEGELTWEDLKQDYLWLKDKCNQLIKN